MSDTSSVSLEVGPGSRETSAATLSPGVSSRGWDDGDTRSEHSYSESGASGSSFEELDLEGEGPLGEARVGPEAEPLGVAKWPREPSIPLRRARSNPQPAPSCGAVAKELSSLFSPLLPPPPGLRLGPGVSSGPDFYCPGPLAKPSPHCPLSSQTQRSRDCWH